MSDALEHHIVMLHYEQGKQKAFYDNMTHELKTPLTSIIGFSDLIDKLDTMDDIRDCNSYIRKESSRLLTMVEELLQTSLKGEEEWRIKMELSDLKPLVADSLNILLPTIQKSHITSTIRGSASEVYVDPKRTQQVLFNIIGNVIKHSECTHLEIKLADQGQYSIIRIKDNGKGIPEDQLATLFLPASERQDREISSDTHGLGLPLAKQFMELQGGAISIQSHEGIGTEVLLKFNRYLQM
ncbi:Sensor protein kinase WalK [compost metagenome]